MSDTLDLPLARPLPPEKYDAWNAYVAAHPTGDLLQSTAWGELKAASGWTPSVVAIEQNGAIKAGMMLLRRPLPMGRSIFYAPRGPVGDWEDTSTIREVLQGGARHALAGGGILLKVDPPWEEPAAAKELEAVGFRAVGSEGGFGGTQPQCVMQLDTERAPDDIIASFHQKWRYNIRLAQKKGVTIRIAEDKADLAAFYTILIETAKRDGFLVRGREYFERMWDCLVPQGWMKLFLGYVGDEPVCGALTYLFGDKSWYTYGASSNAHREKMPNYLMQWEMISWAQRQGCRWYDFRGVSCTPDDPDDKTAGLNRFKSGFNPRFVRYIGEYDLPLSPPMYWAWTKALPKVRAAMKRARGKEAPALSEG